jgi:2-polyprenyl-6-methoxyphenol hydroxylase-like FAD-dependent oxidoreductase
LNHRSSTPLSAPVAIVGAGPVGLALALGLARQGVRSILLERNQTTSRYSKAPGLHVRTREIFRQWGIEQRFLSEGHLLQRLTLHSAIPSQSPLFGVDFRDLEDEADRPGILILEQAHTERLLLDELESTGLCDVRFGAKATTLQQNAASVSLTFEGDEGEQAVEAEYMVGCDGASSFVRQAVGLPFDGITYSLRPMLADIRLGDERDALQWPRVLNGSDRLSFTLRLDDTLWRLVSIEQETPAHQDEVPDEEVATIARQLLGTAPAEVVWASRFRIHIRSAPRFRLGRVLLAGDAAHVHSPAGGLGMNGGIQDAHNLAWKLAALLRGGDADCLLDSYDDERREVVVETVSSYTDFLTRLFIASPHRVRQAAFSLARSLLHIPPLRRRALRRTAMLDLDYASSPLLQSSARSAGVRLPNPRLHSPDGNVLRLYDLLPYAPVALRIGEQPTTSADLPVDSVIPIGPRGYREPAGLLRNLLGGDDGWIIVRPDAHIALATTRLEGLEEAISHALGAACEP